MQAWLSREALLEVNTYYYILFSASLYLLAFTDYKLDYSLVFTSVSLGEKKGSSGVTHINTFS
jgi:hypothetical protein